MKKLTSTNTLLILLFVAACLFSACAGLRSIFTDLPFAGAHVMDGPSGVFAGPSGRTFVIDEGKKSVLVLNEAMEFEFQIDRSDKGYYYASSVAEDEAGNIYIADTLYSGEGTILAAERIFRYDAKGRHPTLVHEIDYRGAEDPPMQYGEICSLRVEGDELTFALKNRGLAQLHRVNMQSGESQVIDYETRELSLSDVTYIPGTDTIVVVTRIGEILLVNSNGAMEFVLGPGTGKVPWRVYANETHLYYTDLSTNALRAFSFSERRTSTLVEGEDILYTAFELDGRVYTTDYVGFYVSENGESSYYSDLALERVALRNAMWICLFAAILLTVLVLALFLGPRISRMKSATFQRMMIVVVVSLSVAGLVSYLILSEMITKQNYDIMEQLGLYADVLVDATDVEALQTIEEITDYRGEDYLSVKEPLDALTDMTYENGLYYYYGIYVTNGEVIYGVLDYEDTMTTRHPFYAYGEEGYTDVFLGDTVEWSADVSSYGSWSFVLKPIFDQEGHSVAIMEVGVNLDDLTEQTNRLVLQIVLTVAAATVVLVMLIIEAIFYLEHLERRRELQAAQDIRHFPIRTLVFLAFFADCMQDAFVSIYAGQLYTPLFGIPPSVGAALPLSAQVLAAALSAVCGGVIIRTAGVKRTLTAGFVIQIAGFLVCATMPVYLGLLGGKVLIGLGMGQIIVSMNSLSASAGSEAASTSAFAAVSAGTLAGVTAGVGIGSVVLSFGTFSTVYFVGAVILTVGVLIALGTRGYQDTMTKTRDEAAPRVSIWRFFADRQIITFLALVLTPFLIVLSYREYFFPIYASEMGISEADIGRIFLACGLVVIYAGPALTERLIAKLGGKWTVALASLLMATGVLLFAFVPTMAAAIVGIVLLSLSTSFGYAAQSAYYSGRPSVRRYGESKAMGIYSLFDNGGQTLGPVLFALAMLLGYQRGMLVVGVCLVALLLLFLLLNPGGRDRETSDETGNGEKGKEAEVC